MKHIIPKFYGYSIFTALSYAFVPIYILFMNSRGLNFAEIGITTGYYYFLFLIIELPTGTIADKLGKKATLILSGIFRVLTIIAYLSAHSFWAFIVGETFAALARSLASGADSAFLYESLEIHKNEKLYKKYEGRTNSMRMFAITLGGITAGTLGAIRLEYVYYFALIMAVLAIVFACTLSEPHQNMRMVNSFKAYKTHLIASCKIVLKNKKMMWLIGYSVLIFILLRASTIFVQQPLLQSLNAPNRWFGYFDAIVSLGGGLVAWNVHRIEKRMGMKGVTFFMPILFIAIFLGVALTHPSPIISMAIFSLILINWGLYETVFRDYLNIEITDSKNRATILSVDSLASRVTFGCLSIILGFLVEYGSIRTTFIFLAAIAFVGVILLTLLKRRWVIE